MNKALSVPEPPPCPPPQPANNSNPVPAAPNSRNSRRLSLLRLLRSSLMLMPVHSLLYISSTLRTKELLFSHGMQGERPGSTHRCFSHHGGALKRKGRLP